MNLRRIALRHGGLVPCCALVLLLAACGADGGSAEPQVQLGVAGTVRYVDRLYGPDGFTGEQPQRPIRFAAVQLVAEDGSVLAETSSDASGAYRLAASLEERREVHVAVAALCATEPYDAQVLDRSDRIYALAGPPFAASAANAARTEDLLATPGNLGGAFNILDQTVRGFDLVLSVEPGARFPTLRVRWAPGSADGTYFTRGNEIHLLGMVSDPDEYDDDVVLHEFGHYVAHNFSWDTSPGGRHDPFDGKPEPPALAWSEGFAHWISSEARASALYVDTYARGRTAFDLEGPTEPKTTRGEGNELAVGAILWDISDAANEAHDALDRQRGALWEVTATYFLDTRPDSTIAAFCGGWHARRLGRARALQALFAHRGIFCP